MIQLLSCLGRGCKVVTEHFF